MLIALAAGRRVRDRRAAAVRRGLDRPGRRAARRARASASSARCSCTGSPPTFERARTRDVFARFVPDTVVDQVLTRATEEGDPRLGGERMDATVLFSDLRGFTSFAEARDPEQVIEVLNRYLTAMSDAILDHDGTLVAYMGDGIMAVFGAPGRVDRPRRPRARRRPRDARSGSRSSTRGSASGGHGDGFKMGIGLHSGPVMSGNVGSARRLEYAAIGDTTNTAARLEGMTKGTPYQLFVGEPTRDRLRARAGGARVRVRAGGARARARDPRLGPARDAGAGGPTLAACMTRVPLLLALLLAARARRARAGGRAPRAPGLARRGRRRAADRRRTPASGTGWCGAGVESVRTAVRWYELQPYAQRGGRAAGGRGALPRRRRRADRLHRARRGRRRRRRARAGGAARRAVDARLGGADAGRRHVAARRPGRRSGASWPRSSRRYGPQGSLWAERPDLPRVPVRAWQVWNEPNLTRYWSEQPFARSYVRLLRAADAALRAADPGATVVLAGLPNESWTALRRIYEAGGRGHFDAVALHPYTRRPRDVLRLVRYARARDARARRRAHADLGDRAVLAGGEGQGPAAGGLRGRPTAARRRGSARALRLLARPRAAPADRAACSGTRGSRARSGRASFDWSGLRRVRAGGRVSAPALAVFRRRRAGFRAARRRGDARRCR